MYPTGYPPSTSYQHGASLQSLDSPPSLAEAVGNGMNVAGMRLPSSPGQFESFYMDCGAIGATVPEPSPMDYPNQQILDDLKDFAVNVKQETSDTDWGDGTSSIISEQDSPPKPRRGRLPMNDDKLTPYERQKKERRREQNRRAARKCREKRKVHQDGIISDYQRLQTENTRLREQNHRIEAERQRLYNILRSHEKTCSLRTPSYNAPSTHTCSTSSIDTNDQMLSDEIADFVFENSSL